MADEPEEDTPEQGLDEENGDDATDVEEDISAAEEAVDLPADADISAEDTRQRCRTPARLPPSPRKALMRTAAAVPAAITRNKRFANARPAKPRVAPRGVFSSQRLVQERKIGDEGIFQGISAVYFTGKRH